MVGLGDGWTSETVGGDLPKSSNPIFFIHLVEFISQFKRNILFSSLQGRVGLIEAIILILASTVFPCEFKAIGD